MTVTLAELQTMHIQNADGVPRSFSPHEWRIGGKRLMLGMAVALALVLVMLAILL